jgi:hypothetical protein
MADEKREQVEDLRLHMHDRAGPAQLLPAQIELVSCKGKTHPCLRKRQRR